MARMWLRPADTPAWESEIPSQVRAQTAEFGTERLKDGRSARLVGWRLTAGGRRAS